jgi:glycine/D-amino acid oxidase-like deaminating enzyme
MNDQELLRYSRHILLNEIGVDGQQRLREASMLVIGAGGLGSPAAFYLASAGVARITLVDGDRVIADSGEIIEHLRALGEPPPDAGEHAARGRFRLVTKLDLAPARALDRLRAVLDRAGIPVVAEIPGEALAPDRLPAGYTLVHAAVPAAAAKVVQSDPTIPSAVTIPMAVFAVEGGSEIAVTRPLAGAWLYCNPEACSITYALTERVVQAVKEL